MNHNEEVPDFLGGLGDMLPADVLKKVNQLLERVHRKDKDHQGSPVFIYAPGSQYVDTQINICGYPDKHWGDPPRAGDPPRPSLRREGERHWGIARRTCHRRSHGPLAESPASWLHKRALPTSALADAGGTPGRCDGGAAGHQREMEGVRGPLAPP